MNPETATSDCGRACSVNRANQQNQKTKMIQPIETTSEAVEIPIAPEPLTYTVRQAAAALNVSEKTIRRFLERGILTSSTALRKKLIPRRQVQDFLKATCGVPAHC